MAFNSARRWSISAIYAVATAWRSALLHAPVLPKRQKLANLTHRKAEIPGTVNELKNTLRPDQYASSLLLLAIQKPHADIWRGSRLPFNAAPCYEIKDMPVRITGVPASDNGAMFLLIDNYDSFVYNLYHYLGELGVSVEVVRNDAITVDEVLQKRPQGLVISPGPCDPDRAGICLDLIAKAAGEVPILGVCLGHQAIGQAFGGHVTRGPDPMHGKVSHIQHRNAGVFVNLPSPLDATRYHSLIVERESFPDDVLEITAENGDGIIMGLQHRQLPIHGVQFHPESIASQHGHALLRNFLREAGQSV